MHGVNLDLLRTAVHHHADGWPKDPHAHHQATHLAALRAARKIRWLALLDRHLNRSARSSHGRTAQTPGLATDAPCTSPAE